MKNKKGITLISLVITIIILIILAGIGINLSIGENGLFNKAKLAKEETINAQINENDKILEYGNEIESYLYGSREVNQSNILYRVSTGVIDNTSYSSSGQIIMPNVEELTEFTGGKAIAGFVSNKVNLLENSKLTLPKGKYTFESFVPVREAAYGVGYEVVDSNGNVIVDHTYNSTTNDFETTDFELENETDIKIYWYRTALGWVDFTYYTIRSR